MATAVLRLYPEAKLDIGPPTDTGFYYDFDLAHKFTAEDLKRIEVEMKNVVKERQPFERIEVTREEAEKFFRDIGEPRWPLCGPPNGESLAGETFVSWLRYGVEIV